MFCKLKFNRRILKTKRKYKVLILSLFSFLIISIAICYLLLYFPIGNFIYTYKKIKIEIYLSESLLTFQDPVYNKSVTIYMNGETYRKSFQSQETEITFMELSNGKYNFFVIIDPFIGTSKCINSKCCDFFYKSEVINSNDSRSMTGDTISIINFKDFIFHRINKR